MSVSLTELRQRLFQLADRVAETGEPLIVVRNGVRLRLVRDDQDSVSGGRLARLRKQDAWIGAAPDPHFSPALWVGESPQRASLRVAEPEPPMPTSGQAKRRRAKK
ncbi:MAG: type II toxin-antitoxin system prevent-host-death family antitoxin [Rudaea sp.]|uniref:type II toxin-antitoxin system prevent-host-death family antitoxin n=1 Tax=Rudaea sp. TaxID=2136325 RepID=UPI0039E2AD43